MVKKGKVPKKDNFLKVGDVVEADGSWCIEDMAKDGAVFINQKMKKVYADTGRPVRRANFLDTSRKETKCIPNVKGAQVNEGNDSLVKRVEQAGISLKKMKFLVVDTKLTGGGTGMGPNDI